jgi:hypothetical protein
VPTTPDKANLISLPYTYQIDGFPVYFKIQTQYPFLFSVNSQGTLQSVQFSPFFTQLTPLQKLPTIGILDAIKNVNQGQASLLGATNQLSATQDFSQIQSANLTTVSLEYRIDPKTALVYPFYRFSGDAVEAKGQAASIIIITPAVATVPTASQ